MDEHRPDFMQNAMRVVEEATGQRPKTRPPEDEECVAAAVRGPELDRRVAG